jgi:hypothetical protein
MAEIIRKIFFINGKALFNIDSKRYVDAELYELYDSVYSKDLVMDSPEKDRENMRSDVHNIRQDLKRSIKNYQLEKSILNG